MTRVSKCYSVMCMLMLSQVHVTVQTKPFPVKRGREEVGLCG